MLVNASESYNIQLLVELYAELLHHLELTKHADNLLNMLKIENEAEWEGKDDFSAKRNTKDETLLHIPVENETLIDGNQGNVHFRDAPSDVLLHKTTLVENRAELHSYGSITEIKLPELIVHFEDDGRQIVKDICVDDGPHAKILLENNDDNLKDVFENLKQDLSFDSLKRDGKDQISSLCLSEFGENTETLKQVTTDISIPKFSLEQPLSLGEPDGDFKAVDSASFTNHKQNMDGKNIDESMEAELLSIKASSESDSAGGNQSIWVIDNPTTNAQADTLPEGSPTITSSTSDAKILKQSNETKKVLNEKVESGRTDPQVKCNVAENGREQSRQNTGNDQQHAQTHSVTEDTAHDVTTSAKNSFYNYYSDLHLSGPSYLAGPKVSSGHIAYSGSISLRSDSSTTSTRSFAFPVLQSEWNSSPVKMAKPDRRKHRRLKTVLFCCKF